MTSESNGYTNDYGACPDDPPGYRAGLEAHHRDPDGNGRKPGRGPSQADRLVGIAKSLDLFCSPDGTAYADLEVGGHRETHRVRSPAFRRWLAHRHLEEIDGAPSSDAMQVALNTIEALAHFRRQERVVFVRTGSHDGALYIDLGDATWRAVEITATGWQIVDRAPVRFRRSSDQQPLPAPVRGGSLADLRPFINVGSDDEFVLVVSWLLAALRSEGPFPILSVSGEQGAAKSTASAFLRTLVDPNTAPLRALPREDRDLFITATNSHVLAFDNISGLPAWLSDTLCRLATDGGFAVRALYSDDDERIFNACRPVILNGIEDSLTRGDLADRAIAITFRAIPETSRRTKGEVWERFNAAHPGIFGALLDCMAIGLRQFSSTKLDRLPRMADFAVWATACETGHSPAGTFMQAYGANRAATVETVLEADPVAGAIMKLMDGRDTWTGAASELLTDLARHATEEQRRSKGWPPAANALSGKLRRAATFLRRVGIDVEVGRSSVARLIWITRTATPSEGGGHCG